jgi:hypothetical protein
VNSDFHERLVGMYFYAAPPLIHPQGLGGIAIALVGPVGSAGPAFTYLSSATDTANNPGWPSHSLLRVPEKRSH